MTHTQYTAYFREIARRHKGLLHSDAECHFVRIVLQMDEFGSDNIAEFIKGQRSRLKLPLLLLVAYDHDYTDNGGDQFRKVYKCSFIILDKTEGLKFDQVEEVFNLTEKIGEDILAFIIRDFAEKLNQYRLLTNEMGGEKIADVEGLSGTRFHLAFTRNYNGPLYHNPTNWID